MTNERKIKVFDNLVNWIWEHTEHFYGPEEFQQALLNCGFTLEEMTEMTEE